MDVVVTVAMAMIVGQSRMVPGRRLRDVARCSSIASALILDHLPSGPVAIVSWLRFCSASFSSIHFWNSSSVSWTVTLPRIL